MKKWIVTVLFLAFMCLPHMATSQDLEYSNPDALIDGATYSFVMKGEKSPRDGVLLSMQALATIKLKNELELERARLDAEYKLLMAKVGCDKDYEILSSSYDIEKASYEDRLEIKNKEINKLYKISTKYDGDGHRLLWGVGGFVVGIGTAVLITYTVLSVK